MRSLMLVLLLVLTTGAVGCTPLNIAPASSSAATPHAGPRFAVPRPTTWVEKDRPDIFEAAVTEFVHPETESRIVVTTLQPAASPAIEATDLLSRYARNGWETASIASGEAAFVMTKGGRTVDVRVVRPERCPGQMSCVAIFEGRWPTDLHDEFAGTLSYVMQGFRFLL